MKTSGNETFVQYLSTGIRDGSWAGLTYGIKASGAITATVVYMNGLEKVNRTVFGNEPKWPIYESDFDLPQFEGIEPYEISALSAACLIVFAPATIGATLGGIYGGLTAAVRYLSDETPVLSPIQ